MQSRGAIRFFAIAFALVCLFSLSFTFVTRNVEKKAERYANSEMTAEMAKRLAKGDELRQVFISDSLVSARRRYYLDSMKNETVYNIGKKYTYQDCKEREINLGLDLKGGMNVTMEVSVADIVRALSGYSKDPTFNEAIRKASEKMKDSQEDFITLFANAFYETDPNAKLAAIYAYEFKNRGITTTSTNDEVLEIIRKETKGAIDRSFEILRTRIDRFGVAQPNIQKLQQTGRILIELPGIKEPERVRKLLQGSAKLEFWETFKFNEIHTYFTDANARLRQIEKEEAAYGSEGAVDAEKEEATTATEKPKTSQEAKGSDKKNTTETSSGEEQSLEELIEDSDIDSEDLDKQREDWEENNPLFRYLQPSFYQNANGQVVPGESASVGSAFIKDTAKVNYMLRKVKQLMPRDMILVWANKPESYAPDRLQLVALKVTSRDGKAPLGGDVIVDARQDYDQNGRVEVSMAMNSEGARVWKRLTGENVGRQIAIVLDDYVYSFPNVRGEIAGGRSSISGGDMSVEEAQDIANILKAGKLPAPARIVQEEIVGPSLGREAVRSGINSFIIAFILVMVYMVLYYNRGGYVADLALLTNVFFIFGVLSSLGAVLTLPGIAGIVLTIGMAVDANVIIYERIKEEIRVGKGIRLAVEDGYKNAYSAIIDGNITTLLTAIVLYVFGSGPVQGFATTLIIGILSSLFSAIFISRLIFSRRLSKNRTLQFSNKVTANWFTNINVDFIAKRKTFYIISAAVIAVGIISLATRGLNQGVDFAGGRTYVVRFDKDISTEDIRSSLAKEFGSAPEVKTFGPSRQVKVTTNYMIEEMGVDVDSIVESKLYNGLKNFYKEPLSYKDFAGDSEEKLAGILSSQMVGPTIADDIKQRAVWAILISLIVIFAYIAARFRRWQFGVGGLVTLAHDAMITVSIYSLFYGVLPFNLEIDQSFIAAILTIIGYSINDTVIIFDRIREYVGLHPKHSFKDNINGAVNSTLGRTFLTSGTTFIVLLSIFILGGEVIRGMTFALMVGILVGTYSSVFISTPVAYDLTKNKGAAQEGLARKKKEKIKLNNQ
ncbi:MAG: protein translocase subunit SecDF [Bacteroidetes bacterium]|nr:MAG: protein translocase subunit SecDF [Bacteroidota bacterium]